jgi:hypothetical protein
VARKKPKSKPVRKVSPASRPTASRGSSPNSDVERRWQEYWARRQELESAIVQVKDAQVALDRAREAEHALRPAFDETKRSPKALLDVEPTDGPSAEGGSGVEELN